MQKETDGKPKRLMWKEKELLCLEYISDTGIGKLRTQFFII